MWMDCDILSLLPLVLECMVELWWSWSHFGGNNPPLFTIEVKVGDQGVWTGKNNLKLVMIAETLACPPPFILDVSCVFRNIMATKWVHHVWITHHHHHHHVPGHTCSQEGHHLIKLVHFLGQEKTGGESWRFRLPQRRNKRKTQSSDLFWWQSEKNPSRSIKDGFCSSGFLSST